jgi:uncharacterized ParB-like nuclease family protein
MPNVQGKLKESIILMCNIKFMRKETYCAHRLPPLHASSTQKEGKRMYSGFEGSDRSMYHSSRRDESIRVVAYSVLSIGNLFTWHLHGF